MKTAIYAGSFDPIHQGHLDILNKASKLFDKVYLVVTTNINKKHTYDLTKRAQIVKENVKNMDNIEVLLNDTKLTFELAKELGVKYLIRGVRDTNDLQYEIDLADANKIYNDELETVFFIADTKNRNISSTLLKEIDFYRNK